MTTNEDIKKTFEKYNNFEKYSDIAKYFLLDNDKFYYIYELVRLMEFDDIESISSSIKLAINLLEEYNVNLFPLPTGGVYELVEIIKDAPDGEIPEMELKLDKDVVKLLESDLHLFNKENIDNMVYDTLNEGSYAEVKNTSDREIKKVACSKSYRGVNSYSIINDLVLGRGRTLYEFPIQLVIHRIYKQNGELYFQGKVYITKAMTKNLIFRINQL